MRWTSLCRQHAAQAGLPPACCDPLAAFGPGEEQEFRSFSTLRTTATERVPHLPSTIVAVLSAEVDPPQAAMFARRFAAVDALLARQPAPEAVLLRIGLVMRTTEILAGRQPRALRVRAVVDFYYSQAALLHHRHPAAPPLRALVDALHWRTTAPGIAHARLCGLTMQGPVHVNVLRVRGRMQTLDCRGQGALPAVVATHGADAGISGGFFLYSEPDILLPSARTDPVGLLVHHEAVCSPPMWHRTALTEHPAGPQKIQALGLVGCTLCWPDGAQHTIEAVNDVTHRGVVAFTRAAFEHSPDRAGTVIAVVGGRVVARGEHGLPIPLAGAVISMPAAPVGDRIHWRLPVPVAEGIAGGPRLLHKGVVSIALAREDFSGSAPPITFSQDETFDQNLLPRMAVGQTPDQELVCVAVDGRNFERAPGMTLRQTAALCRMLGCTEAMNLDGGSSKRMVVDGRIVDLPSTEVVSGQGGHAGVRPVNTAVLFFGEDG